MVLITILSFHLEELLSAFLVRLPPMIFTSCIQLPPAISTCVSNKHAKVNKLKIEFPIPSHGLPIILIIWTKNLGLQNSFSLSYPTSICMHIQQHNLQILEKSNNVSLPPLFILGLNYLHHLSIISIAS